MNVARFEERDDRFWGEGLTDTDIANEVRADLGLKPAGFCCWLGHELATQLDPADGRWTPGLRVIAGLCYLGLAAWVAASVAMVIA